MIWAGTYLLSLPLIQWSISVSCFEMIPRKNFFYFFLLSFALLCFTDFLQIEGKTLCHDKKDHDYLKAHMMVSIF